MSTAALALLAAIAALAAAVAARTAVRARRSSESRLDSGLLAIGERMDALARELVTTVEKVREDAHRARIVESLGQALDLDEVLARCAEAAAALRGVAGATVSIEVDGVPLSASAGVDGIGTVGGPPDGSRVRAVGISYHYPAGDVEPSVVRSAIAVPIVSARGPLGFLTVFGHEEEPPVTGSDFQVLEAIAAHTGPAVDVARQRATIRIASEGDALTGLETRHALHEMLALEVARAHRHRRKLALCLLDLDDFRQTNERIGQIAGDALLSEVAGVLRETARPNDLAFRSGGDEFAVIMPGAGRIDGEALYARLQGTLARTAGSPVSLSAGIAELKANDDGVSVFERAERGLQRAKQAGKGTAA